MNWVRKGFVGFLAIVLFFALVGSVYAYNLHNKLSDPTKIETLLSESKVYDHAIAAALSQAQDDSSKSGGEISVALTNPVTQKAAEAAFPPSLVQSSVNEFIDSNFRWLSGKTGKPDFSIDLTKPKEDFAKRVGDYVASRLGGLPVCTPEQLAQLQIPVDPLSVSCRPGSLDPKTEGDRVAGEVANSSFLSKPVVTADTLGQDAESSREPYYQRLSHLPKLYQLGGNLSLLLGAVVVLSALGIIFIHPVRRKGLRRVSITLALAGIALIISKLLADKAVNRISDATLSSSTKEQLQPAFLDFLHKVESQVTQSNTVFGIIFIVLAVMLLAYLLLGRRGHKPRQSRMQERRTPATPDTPEEPAAESASDVRTPRPMPSPDISNRFRQPRPTGPPPLAGTPKPRPAQPGQPQTGQSPRPPKRPRLIQ